MKCSVNSCSSEAYHQHHVVPTTLDKESKTVIPLCEKHHNILHNMLPKFYWGYVNDKIGAKNQIEKGTAWFCTNWIDRSEVKLMLGEVKRNIESRLRCPNCDYVILEDLEGLEVYDCPNCSETFMTNEIKEGEDDTNN